MRPIASALLLIAVTVTGCGDDDDVTTGTSATVVETTTTVDATTTTVDATTTTAPSPQQPAIWPAPGVVFATPDEAAGDFVSTVLGVPPVLGAFQQGDSRSGEIEVLFGPAGSSGDPIVRAVLFLRQLGPDDGWFVLGAANGSIAIEQPASMAEVPAGLLTVTGRGRGFEGLVVVTAQLAGSPSPLDERATQGGSMATSEPFETAVDLSGAAPGDVVMLLVRGGVGHEEDPGEFSAIPVVVG